MRLSPAGLVTCLALASLGPARPSFAAPDSPPFIDLRVRMNVDVDGAPNAYGPPGYRTLDYEKNAHHDARLNGKVVGYLTRRDGRTPYLQGPHDPCPGYYISTTDYRDDRIDDDRNPRKYLDARRINYVVLGDFAHHHHVRLGDFVLVHSARTHRTVYAIVGDSGNPSGAEGSLALLQHLGYPFHNGKDDAVEDPEITIRYFPHSNPQHLFPRSQAALDAAAASLHLDRRFTP